MLFQTFKMRLHDDHGGADPVAYATNGRSQPLLKLIMLSLKYVKEEAMEEINRSQPRAMSLMRSSGCYSNRCVLVG